VVVVAGRAFLEVVEIHVERAVPGATLGKVPPGTEIVQGWPKLWANFRALVGIFSQSVGPSIAIWANPVQFSFGVRGGRVWRGVHAECL
jgi:hypothetical protein